MYCIHVYILARFLPALVVESCWYTLQQPHWTGYPHVLYNTYKGSKSQMLHLPPFTESHSSRINNQPMVKHAKKDDTLSNHPLLASVVVCVMNAAGRGTSRRRREQTEDGEDGGRIIGNLCLELSPASLSILCFPAFIPLVLLQFLVPPLTLAVILSRPRRPPPLPSYPQRALYPPITHLSALATSSLT